MSRVFTRAARGLYHGVPMDDMSEEINAQAFPDGATNGDERPHPLSLTNENPALTENFSSITANQSLDYISFPSPEIESRRSILQCTCSKRCQFMIGIVLALFAMLLIPSVCTSLGYYSIFVKKPAPVIDKSYHSFSIPNHPVSLHYEAFKTAMKTGASDLSTFYHAVLRAKQQMKSQNSKPKKSSFAFKTHNHGKELDFVPKKTGVMNLVQNDGTDDRGVGLERHHDIFKRSLGGNSFTINAHHQYHLEWKLQVVFIAKDGSNNIFTKEKLEHIHKVEKAIINFPQFKEFCYKDIFLDDPAVKSINGCAPLNSLLSYFYPSVVDGKTYYDGLGMTLTSDINETLKLALSSDQLYYFVDDKMNKDHRESQLLRTEVLFGAPLQGYMYVGDKIKEQSKKFKNFVVRYIDLLSESSSDEVKVLYGGNEIFDYEVETTFWQDVSMAYYSGGAIFLFMLIFSSFSIWLTLWGLVAILSCFPLAFYFYRVVFNIRALGILNGVAVFVIIGIGVDDVFVFINIFRQASHIPCRRARLFHTIKTAGKATFFTSFTTAAAFAANMTSSIPAIHAFGLFMSLIVACCWFTVVLIMPPALYIWHLSFYHCEKFVVKKLCKTSSKLLSLPKDISRFVHGNFTPEPDITMVTPTANVIPHDEDDDLPLLTLDDPMEYYISTYASQPSEEDDVPLLDPQFEPPSERDSFVGGILQSVIYHGVAKPVIKARWVILGLSLVIFGVSIALSTQLSPEAKSPRLFRADSNLQMLLDLKEKLGIDSMSCSKCSAVYHLNDQNSPGEGHFPEGFPQSNQHLPKMHSSIKPGWHSWLPATTRKPKNTFTTKHSKVKTTEIQKSHTKGLLPTSKQSTTTTSTTTTTTQKPSSPLTTEEPKIKKTTELEKTTKPKETTKSIKHQNPTLHTSASVSIAPVSKHPHPTSVEPATKQAPTQPSECQVEDCDHPKARPYIETGATVYVVFGVDHVDSSVDVENEGHVVDDRERKVIYDPAFSKAFQFSDQVSMKRSLAVLCTVCKRIAERTDLVKNGTAQCFPHQLFGMLKTSLHLDPPTECQDLPATSKSVFGRKQIIHYAGGMDNNRTGLKWWAFGFESTSKKTQSYFAAYRQFLEWEALISEIKTKDLKDSPHLMSIYQTSDFWTKVMMEVVAVSSAIYGLVLSMLICVISVAIFTGHAVLLFVVFFTIAEMIVLVVAIFYLAGWRMGGVEAVSLSILVGSSVDYCVHLVEGYLLAGKAVPGKIKQDKSQTRQWRTKAALCHIGNSILSSAITTIVAAIPLTQTIIQPFAKFGQIVAINTAVSILYTLTVCTGFLGTLAPSHFVLKWKSVGKALVGTIISVGIFVLLLFVLSKCGVVIPDPNGNSLF